ncbi:MAG: right-handed parallel beta-helix repeat-containing protein [Bacteroidales bacterium]
MKVYHLLLYIVFLSSCSHSEQPASTLGVRDAATMHSAQLQAADAGRICVVKPLYSVRTITVGGSRAEIPGFSSEAIQMAAEALKETGGIILLSPGTYDIQAPVKLYSNTTLKGAGPKTLLKKCRGFRSSFALDADYGELQVTVTDVSGFRPGMGIAIFDDERRHNWDVTTARITAIKGNTLFIDTYLVRDYLAGKNGIVSNACSVVEAVEAENVRIADLTVDGSGDSNDMVDGCRAGGIYLHKVKNALVENVTVKNFNCDGISWQITEHVTVKNCEVSGCPNAGLHPGTGSPYTLIENNNSHDNGGYGLYVCWRARNGMVRNNSFCRNGINGISTGHKDTDMLFEGNRICENGSDGISLRAEDDLNAPHRSVFRNNTIENNGSRGTGYGISVISRAEGIVIENNVIRNTGTGKQTAGIFFSARSLPAVLKDNTFAGHPSGDVVKEE